jgi:hypothetical protein
MNHVRITGRNLEEFLPFPVRENAHDEVEAHVMKRFRPRTQYPTTGCHPRLATMVSTEVSSSQRNATCHQNPRPRTGGA